MRTNVFQRGVKEDEQSSYKTLTDLDLTTGQTFIYFKVHYLLKSNCLVNTAHPFYVPSLSPRKQTFQSFYFHLTVEPVTKNRKFYNRFFWFRESESQPVNLSHLSTTPSKHTQIADVTEAHGACAVGLLGVSPAFDCGTCHCVRSSVGWSWVWTPPVTDVHVHRQVPRLSRWGNSHHFCHRTSTGWHRDPQVADPDVTGR